MQIYDDGDTERDLLYLDLLPAGWESDIGESFITVALPKPVDEEAIQIYAGAYGREDVHENVSWSYDDEKRIISILGTELPEGTGWGRRTPDGYFPLPSYSCLAHHLPCFFTGS